MKRRFKRAAYTAAAAATGIAVPFSGVIAPSVMVVAHAADPEWHAEEGTYGGQKFSYTESTIDPTKTGSIQIYKYEENNGKMTEGTGFADTEANKSKDNETRRPIKGVQFKGLKIADVVTVAGNGIVGTYYTSLSPTFIKLLQDYGLSNVPVAKTFGGADSDKDGKYYTTTSIEEAMELLNNTANPANASDGADNEKPGHVGAERTLSGLQAATNAVNKATNAVDFGYTDENGHLKATNLPLGLYLIAETDYKPNAILNKNTKLTTSDGDNPVPDEYPYGAKYSKNGQDVTGDNSQNHQDVDVSTAPYLVSLPMTNVADFTDNNQKTHKAGTVWFYDLTTYPKNQTTNITKKIVDPDSKDMMNGENQKIGVKGDSADNGNTKSLEDYETYSMGDTVHQVIYADAAANMSLGTVKNSDGKDSTRAQQNPNRYTTYSISDDMAEGLKFDGVTKVVYGKKVADPKKVGDFSGMQELELNKDYKVIKEPIKVNQMTETSFDANQRQLDEKLDSQSKTSEGKPTDTKFCVQLTSRGIAKLNALTTDSQVVVFFDSQVTPKAKIGTDDKNTNQAHLEVKHEFTSTLDKMSNETRVFTFEIDAVKKAETKSDGSKLPDDFHPEKTAFTVKQTKHEGDGWASKDDTRAKTTNIQLDNTVKVNDNGDQVPGATRDTDWDDTDFVKFVQEEAGVYHVFADKTDDASKATTIVHPAPDGKLRLKGLDDAKYTVTERATQDHYSLQKSSFDIDLRAATQTDDADYRSEAALGRQAKNGLLHYEHVNGALTDATKIYTADGGDKGSTLPRGGNADTEKDNQGIVHFEIYNGMTNALRTGGKGVTGIYIAAASTGAAVAAAYVIKRKKDQKAER